MLDRHDRLGPHAALVYRGVRERILSGALPPGSQLPAQRELAREYGVALMTARHALQRLEHEGLISSVSGRGTFVAPAGQAGHHMSGMGAPAPDAAATTRTEQALRFSEQRLQAHYQSNPVPTYTWQRHGDDWVLIDFNVAAEMITQGRVHAYLGRSCRSVYAYIPDIIKDFDRVMAAEGRVMHRELEYRLVSSGEEKTLAVSYVFMEPDLVVVYTQDVTEQKQAERAYANALRRAEDAESHYRSLVEQIPAIVYRTAAAEVSRISYVSPHVEALLGYTPDEYLSRPDGWVSLVHPDDRERVVTADMETNRTGQSFAIDYRALTRDGRTIWLRDEATLVRDERGTPLYWQGLLTDISERKHAEEALSRSEEQLRHQALHDALTDLPNRTLFHDRLSQVLLGARREGSPFALLLADLDRFKDVNDTLGHDTGDLLLQQVSARLRHTLRESDTVARLGGDEFAVLLPGTGHPDAIQVIAKLLTSLGEPFFLEGQTLYVGASIGLVLFPEHGDDAATLLRRADVAMYMAKRSGGGYACYQPDADPHSERRLTLMAALREAIDHDQLMLHYQPKVDLATGRADQVEALVRWRHPEHGFIPPDQFITLAEHTGLIKPLSLWVLNHALQQSAAWREEGRDIAVAVNLSAWNLQDPGLVDTIASHLAKWDLPPALLGIEITESALMDDPTHAMATLTFLHDLGIKIAIDDFGTGYSSLAYLHALPVDEIKIDRSFVLGMADAASGSALIVRSVVDLGHNLELRVVAEGVETQHDLDVLGTMRCDLVQGYYLGKPMPSEQYLPWLDVWEQHAWLAPPPDRADRFSGSCSAALPTPLPTR